MTTHYVDCNSQTFYRFRDNERGSLVLYAQGESDFQTGDLVMVRQASCAWNTVARRITHVLHGSNQEGIRDGYVVLSLEDQRVKHLREAQAENEKLIRSNRALRARAKRLARLLAEAQS